MNQVSTVGLDLAKYIFQLHGADSAGAVVFRKKLRRTQLLAFLATLPPCTVALEACASAHYWGREIAKLDHTVKLIAPAYAGQQDGPDRLGPAGQGWHLSSSGRGCVSARGCGAVGGVGRSKERMAQQSMRRDQDNQNVTKRFERAALNWS